MTRLFEYVQTEMFPDQPKPAEGVYKYKGLEYKRSSLELIKKQCSQIIKEYDRAGRVLFRGTNSTRLKDIDETGNIFKVYPREDRRPKDTPLFMQEKLDDLFFKVFKWKPRSQGVFAVANYGIAHSYGNAYAFFPVNGYKYVWSMRIDDLYGDYIEKHQYDYEEYDIRELSGNWVNTEDSSQKMRYLGYADYDGFVYKKHRIVYDKKDKYEALVTLKHRLTDEIKEVMFEFVPDLTEKEWKQEAEDKTMEIINTYQDDDLDVAMRTTSKEIMFKCDMYYLMKMPTTIPTQKPTVYDLGLTRWI